MATLLLLALAAGGCSDDETAPATPVMPPVGCSDGEYEREDGSCAPLGLPPDMACPPGAYLHNDGCAAAGVPPDGCAAGFNHDGARACEPVLPADACPFGEMVVPGETLCREPAPCGNTKWDGIAVDSATQHVDQSYTGGNSDGTAMAPWTTVQEGIDAAAPGATVAIAAGDYAEDIVVGGAPKVLWGRCPRMVQIVGNGGSETVYVQGGASGTELRDLAISGTDVGLSVYGARDVLVEGVWIHDTGYVGADIDNALGNSAATFRRSLVEQALLVGVFVSGAEVVFDESMVSWTRREGSFFGRGFEIQAAMGSLTPGTLTMTRSVVTNNRDAGVSVLGANATIEGSVVSNTQQNGSFASGLGVTCAIDPLLDVPSSLELTSSVVEGNALTGVFVDGATAVIDRSVIRSTDQGPSNEWGRGVSAQSNLMTQQIADVTVRHSLVFDTVEVGIFGDDALVTVEGSAVLATRPVPTNGAMGRGINTVGPLSMLTVRDTFVADNHAVGITVAGGPGDIASTLVRTTTPTYSNSYGDGIVALAYDVAADLAVYATRVEDNARVGLSNFGSHVTIEASELACQPFDMLAGQHEERAPSFDDHGGNVCGCPATAPCTAVQDAVAAPPAVGGLE